MLEELNRCVYIYCGEIVNKKPLSRKRKKRNVNSKSKVKSSFWDYPAMASVCKWVGNNKKYRGCSKKANDSNYPDSILKKELLLLGSIGSSNKKFCKYPIGNCAEPHAARELLKNERHCRDLKDIHFSVAMRPRTREIFPPCENCKRVFPTLR